MELCSSRPPSRALPLLARAIAAGTCRQVPDQHTVQVQRECTALSTPFPSPLAPPVRQLQPDRPSAPALIGASSPSVDSDARGGSPEQTGRVYCEPAEWPARCRGDAAPKQRSEDEAAHRSHSCQCWDCSSARRCRPSGRFLDRLEAPPRNSTVAGQGAGVKAGVTNDGDGRAAGMVSFPWKRRWNHALLSGSKPRLPGRQQRVRIVSWRSA